MPVAALAAAIAAASAGCAGPRAPKRLVGGEPAPPPPLQLEGVSGPALLAKVRQRPWRGSSWLASCLREMGGGAGEGAAVERMGARGRSVTVRERGGRRLLGCDAAARPGDEGRRWCGAPVGRLNSGRLSDPRLEIGCRAADGRPVAFAWIEPGRKTRYLAVRQRGYTEVYQTAAGLPIRVTTDDVDTARARATFSLSAHDAQGRLLRRWRLETVVAG